MSINVRALVVNQNKQMQIKEEFKYTLIKLKFELQYETKRFARVSV